MKYDIPVRVHNEINELAELHHIEQVILFGSRAKGTNTQRSDIDIAVKGGDFNGFYWDVKEKINSLLMFDIVDTNGYISNDLADEIKKYGVILYEKA